MRPLVALCAVALLVCSASQAATPLVPTPIGVGARFHPDPSNTSVERGRPVGSLACSSLPGGRSGVHLELFAFGRVVIVPAGIGLAPPLRRHGAAIVSGRCSYPARTREPTGVIELVRSARLTLGQFFAVWGRPLSARRLVGFRIPATNPVRAYVDGRRWEGDLGAIPLRSHAEIVLQVGRYIPQHTSYRFPDGL